MQLLPDPPGFGGGAIAQLGERLLCKQEVAGSIPAGSTSSPPTRAPRDDASSCEPTCWLLVSVRSRDRAVTRDQRRCQRAHRLLFNNPEKFLF